MGRFAISARVVDENDEAGEIMDKRKGERLVRYDNTGLPVTWVPKAFLRREVSENAYLGGAVGADKWVPKVGDRVRHRYGDADVRAVDSNMLIEFDEPNASTHQAYGEYEALLQRVRCAYFVRGDEIEPVVAPATTAAWVPAVGDRVRFVEHYTARARIGDEGVIQEFWEADGNPKGGLWLTRFGEDRPEDLVAEWVDPAVVAVAEATATLKVGDRVRPVSDKLGWVTSHWAAYWKDREGASEDDTFFVVLIAGWGDVKISARLGGDGPYWPATDFELVESATPEADPPAKFKVGDRVVIASSPYGSEDAVAGCYGVISAKSENGFRGDWVVDLRDHWSLGYRDAELTLLPTIPINSTVTFTATGRLSAINDNGHMQVTFPGLPAGRNSFALPAEYVALAN